jgi:hypothetical protein
MFGVDDGIRLHEDRKRKDGKGMLVESWDVLSSSPEKAMGGQFEAHVAGGE